MDRKKPHRCYHVKCRNCNEFQHADHRCFIQPVSKEEPEEEDEESDDEKKEKKVPLLKCLLTLSATFHANLICWAVEDDDAIYHASINPALEFLEAMEELAEKEERKVMAFFQNLRGFDVNFILQQLYDEGCAITSPLTQGTKMLYFEAGDLVFKDSMNFFAMALDKFPATFNLEELHKGFFSSQVQPTGKFSVCWPLPSRRMLHA